VHGKLPVINTYAQPDVQNWIALIVDIQTTFCSWLAFFIAPYAVKWVHPNLYQSTVFVSCIFRSCNIMSCVSMFCFFSAPSWLCLTFHKLSPCSTTVYPAEEPGLIRLLVRHFEMPSSRHKFLTRSFPSHSCAQ